MNRQGAALWSCGQHPNLLRRQPPVAPSRFVRASVVLLRVSCVHNATTLLHCQYGENNYFCFIFNSLLGFPRKAIDGARKNVKNTSMAEKKLIQWWISADAFRRIKVVAAIENCGPGDIVTQLAEDHLPPVKAPEAIEDEHETPA